MQTSSTGALYIVATPIGNLADISLRAIDILQQVDVIAAEDTRHSRKLLQHYSITSSMVAYHEHNEASFAQTLLTKLQQGQQVALISDAGTPLISDPGFSLVRLAQQQGIQVIPVPGACAAIAALSCAGLASDRFSFEGFLPAKQQARLNKLTLLKSAPQTLIFYLSPHRVLGELDDLSQVFGEQRYAVIAKELTKLHETIRSGSLAQLKVWLLDEAVRQKGEFVLLVKGAEQEISAELASLQQTLQVLLEELSLKQSVSIATKLTGLRKKIVYQMALELQDND